MSREFKAVEWRNVFEIFTSLYLSHGFAESPKLDNEKRTNEKSQPSPKDARFAWENEALLEFEIIIAVSQFHTVSQPSNRWESRCSQETLDTIFLFYCCSASFTESRTTLFNKYGLCLWTSLVLPLIEDWTCAHIESILYYVYLYLWRYPQKRTWCILLNSRLGETKWSSFLGIREGVWWTFGMTSRYLTIFV